MRLPWPIGQSHALDLILTGCGVSGEEALRMGLANRLGALSQWGMEEEANALREETRRGLEVIRSGETEAGAKHFAGGDSRHGEPL